MQLLNSKILSNDKNTRYSNKKAQDTRVTCAFCLLQLFRTTKMVGSPWHKLNNRYLLSHSRFCKCRFVNYYITKYPLANIYSRFLHKTICFMPRNHIVRTLADYSLIAAKNQSLITNKKESVFFNTLTLLFAMLI